MEWDNRPAPFKHYPDRPGIELPAHLEATRRSARQNLREPLDSPRSCPCSVHTLAALCFYAAGVTRETTLSSGDTHYFRAAACAGALYPTELYVVAGEGTVTDLDAGIYHYHPLHQVLTPLRNGDWRGYLEEQLAADGAAAQASLTVVLSSIPWRSSWKYAERAYRHLFWDAGTILANLLGMVRGVELTPRLHAGFLDGPVNRLLGLDGRSEFAVAAVTAGGIGGDSSSSSYREPEPIDPDVPPISPNPRRFERIQEAYRASCFKTADQLAGWSLPEEPSGPHDPSRFHAPETPDQVPPSRDALETVILRRGSSRAMRREPIPGAELHTVLRTALSPLPNDWDGPYGLELIAPYLLVSAVDGLEPGGYAYDTDRGFCQLSTDDEDTMRRRGAHLCLGQRLGGEAAVLVFTMADLEEVLEGLGNRGYRAAQTSAGIVLGRLNLATYARRLASTGLTFFDDRVTGFFAPHAAGTTPMTCCAIGLEARRSGLR